MIKFNDYRYLLLLLLIFMYIQGESVPKLLENRMNLLRCSSSDMSQVISPISHEYSDQQFQKEFSLLKSMDMIVPLVGFRRKVAACSRTDTFQYIPLHVRYPSMLKIRSPLDHFLPIRKDESSDNTRDGIYYEADDIIDFNPEVSIL